MNWYKKAQTNYPKSLTGSEMVNFILDNSLKDWLGELDLNSAREIAHSSNQWVLTQLSLDFFNWTSKSLSQDNIPPIVLRIDENEYEVLDGRHRIGAAKVRGDKIIQVYLGTI